MFEYPQTGLYQEKPFIRLLDQMLEKKLLQMLDSSLLTLKFCSRRNLKFSPYVPHDQNLNDVKRHPSFPVPHPIFNFHLFHFQNSALYLRDPCLKIFCFRKSSNCVICAPPNLNLNHVNRRYLIPSVHRVNDFRQFNQMQITAFSWGKTGTRGEI